VNYNRLQAGGFIIRPTDTPFSPRGEMGAVTEAKLRPIEREYREVFPGVSVSAGKHVLKRGKG